MLDYRMLKLEMEPVASNDAASSAALRNPAALEFRKIACEGDFDEEKLVFIGPCSRSILGSISLWSIVQDLHFFVTGEEENELILASVLQGFFDSVERLLKNMVDKRTALENLDLILLCLDEIVDGGVIHHNLIHVIRVAINGGLTAFSYLKKAGVLESEKHHPYTGLMVNAHLVSGDQ